MHVHFLAYTNKKIEIAQKLYNGELGGSYSEAILILSSVLSAISRIIYPGKNEDKLKVVEILIRNNLTGYDFSYISLKLLSEDKNVNGDSYNNLVRELKDISFNNVTHFDKIDQKEHIVSKVICPDLDTKVIRKYSYANIFYEYIRSYLVHEYRLAKEVTTRKLTSEKTFVSYNPSVLEPYLKMHFHFEAIKEIVKSLSYEVGSKFSQYPLLPPAQWWLKGG